MLPSDHSAEAYVLGQLLNDCSQLDDVQLILSPDDFSHPAHAAIYASMLRLRTAGTDISCVTVLDDMKAARTHGQLVSLGGDGFVIDLLVADGLHGTCLDEARIVKQLSTRRRLILLCAEIKAKAERDGAQAAELIAELQEGADTVAEGMIVNEPKAPKGVLHAAVQVIKDRQARGAFVTGISSGLAALDAVTSGWQPGQLIVIAARPSIGKSALAMQCLTAAARRRIPGLMFSLEMPDQELGERMLAEDANLDSTLLRSGQLDRADISKLDRCVQRLIELPFLLDDDPGQTLATISAKTRRWRRNKARFPAGLDQLGLVVVDYLQLVDCDAPGENREREVAQLSKGLKRLAKKLRVPVIALAQLNRECEKRQDKRPVLADLRESGAIEQDADTVVLVHREGFYKPNMTGPRKNIAELIVAKQRGGPTGCVEVLYRPQTTSFADLSPRDSGR